MLITEEYRRQNIDLHRMRSDYGARGHRHADMVRQLCEAVNSREVLDYGCGKGTLGDALIGYDVRNYDPAFPEWAELPEPADIVVCGDVLEHIEPECIDDVMDDLKRVTKKMLFAVVATRPAVKTLPDGRNTHLIVRDIMWWLPKFWDRFILGSFHNLGGEIMLICGVKTPGNGQLPEAVED